ncbi:acid phosphatase [Oleiagrimonas sp. C23AA]|uniref:acid phosphatase n=1 Tax=Oleiagrimonas sp. C23AA TaxID=2719047 RepID=UPI00141DAEEB|nr:acid phosphatase [Oleiagrimonas sp. C23AA]NII10753.1 acid phosphatase [Oleiagrimonas sp. C23AA]
MSSSRSDDSKPTPPESLTPASPERRRLLGGLAAAGAALAVGGCASKSDAGAKGAKAGAATASTSAGGAQAQAAGEAVSDQWLAENIHNVVVIYAENRSFNNLFADFPGLEKPLSALKPEQYVQKDRDGSTLKHLPPIWHGLVPHPQTVGHTTYHIKQDDLPTLTNAPFALKTPEGEPLPHGLVTRDLIHAFYQNQKQINGGKNDGFVAWGDSGALVMGHYADSGVNLRLWQLARQYTLCDNFFMGAFGGSFLNHQYLVSAQPPVYPDADHSPASDLIAKVNGDPKGTDLALAESSPASALQGKPKFASPSQLTPDFRAVNTMGPPYWPAFTRDKADPALADPNDAYTLPPQTHETIGDKLSDKGIDWAWYAGGWQMAVDGHGDGDPAQFPQRPNFQYHHQPFNYYKRLAPGTAARQQHLRDGGLGDTAQTNKFIADAQAGKLPPVAFYKPQGNLNMHAGYSDVEAGDKHIAHVVDVLRKSPQFKHMLVVVTFDENGGWWDHVAPPKADRWGPGTRIAALLISPFAKKGHVDHTVYDTGSIARFITRRFGLEKLKALADRETAMQAASGFAPGDLTAALDPHAGGEV